MSEESLVVPRDADGNEGERKIARKVRRGRRGQRTKGFLV